MTLCQLGNELPQADLQMVADPSLGTGLTVLGGAIGLKELIVKVLGPTADYLGSGLKEFTERRAQNLQRIFESAGRLLGDQLEAPGTVPPKVLKGILGEGQFCEDELSAEYFGGVLASSRTDVARDDRGATFVALLGRLSTYQIRSHFFFYTLFREIYLNSGVNFGIQIGRSQLQTFFPASSYTTALELTEKEASHDLANHAVVGLVREMLIDQNFSIGNRDHIRTGYGQADSDGLLIAPSILGAELYLWALGKGGRPFTALLDPAVELNTNVRISTTPGIKSVSFPDRAFPKPLPVASPVSSPG